MKSTANPPGFDRRQSPAVDRKITGFFRRYLLIRMNAKTMRYKLAMTFAITLLVLLAARLPPWPLAAHAPSPLASINDPFAKVDFGRARTTAVQGARRHGPGAAATIRAANCTAMRAASCWCTARHHAPAPCTCWPRLAAAGFEVAALDMRGHGDSGPRGHAAYVGQLEDDVEDFMRAVPHNGPSTLLGFSSGGGFVLRVAGGTRQGLFDRYVLLSPSDHPHPPTAPTMAAGCQWAGRAWWG